MVQVYGIKNCDSVKKALKYLTANHIPYEFINFRETPVDLDTILGWLTHTDIDTLFNTKGTTYRTLKLKEVSLSDTEKTQWLAKENMLIKRPVITGHNQIIVGYNESHYLKTLSQIK
jgi:Spx/MgsR family transcriptional regulator